MCLISVLERRMVPKVASRKGYKIFKVSKSGNLQFPFRCRCRVRVGKWMQASCRYIEADNGQWYRSGFHVYTSRKAAQERGCYFIGRHMIVKVFVRGVRTIGLESYGRVMVADEMFVPAEYVDCTERKKTLA